MWQQLTIGRKCFIDWIGCNRRTAALRIQIAEISTAGSAAVSDVVMRTSSLVGAEEASEVDRYQSCACELCRRE